MTAALYPATYAALPPAARARAWLAAHARGDTAEQSRLCTGNPTARRTVLMLCQGIDAVALMALRAEVDLWRATAQWSAREHWLTGYEAAGGVVEAPAYRAEAEAALNALIALRAAAAVHAALVHAMREWCEREGLTLRDVAAALALPEPEPWPDVTPDPDALAGARDAFDRVRLAP
jgi:hypothetical protein